MTPNANPTIVTGSITGPDGTVTPLGTPRRAQLVVDRVKTPRKAVAAGAGGTAGALASLVVSRIADLDATEAILLTGVLSTAFASAGAYLRKVGPVVLKSIGLPEFDEGSTE